MATTLVNDNTALLLLLREALERRGVRTVFFLTCKEQLPRQIRQLPPASREGLFRVENPHVFAESAFPDLLIANTLTLTSKPADFRGKTMILPHAPSERMPNRLSYWADYPVIPTRDAAPFDYGAFPNFCKHCAGRTLTLLPAGYLKNDLLCASARRLGPAPYRRVSFFPHWKLPRGIRAEALGELWIELIERFFSEFPGWEFILRPLESQRDAPQVRLVREHFRKLEKRLLVDCGSDGLDSLLRTDALLTDYSSVWRNYSFTTLRPAVLFQPDGDAVPAGGKRFSGKPPRRRRPSRPCGRRWRTTGTCGGPSGPCATGRASISAGRSPMCAMPCSASCAASRPRPTPSCSTRATVPTRHAGSGCACCGVPFPSGIPKTCLPSSSGMIRCAERIRGYASPSCAPVCAPGPTIPAP
ncbi:hypothetical protein [uncultured Desulfovibrio sp.]|uniref:hypothetical protein n=1 Tax=uncultured Desulfovibrio sp. TaxID=167968 RepID=UPI00261DE366|nr:hypothetical protein [uncultured Desulfovibrio sp.]